MLFNVIFNSKLHKSIPLFGLKIQFYYRHYKKNTFFKFFIAEK